jgi:hypothetical protein
MPLMAKKQPKKGQSAPEPKAVIYVEVPPALKGRMEELAAAHNRKLTGEVITALQEYIRRHEREGGQQ